MVAISNLHTDGRFGFILSNNLSRNRFLDTISSHINYTKKHQFMSVIIYI